jgi:hypothetical protein
MRRRSSLTSTTSIALLTDLASTPKARTWECPVPVGCRIGRGIALGQSALIGASGGWMGTDFACGDALYFDCREVRFQRSRRALGTTALHHLVTTRSDHDVQTLPVDPSAIYLRLEGGTAVLSVETSALFAFRTFNSQLLGD